MMHQRTRKIKKLLNPGQCLTGVFNSFFMYSVGWGGRIRTFACRNQNPVP